MLNNRAVDTDGTFAFDDEAGDGHGDVRFSRAFTCCGVWGDQEDR
jgi:hypothetical protein